MQHGKLQFNAARYFKITVSTVKICKEDIFSCYVA